MADTITDRNVYILGAGASADAGAPLIKNFLDYSRQLFDQPFSGLEDFEKKHFQTVFDFRRDMAQAREKIQLDLDDIEQLFGLVEVSRRLRDIPLETRNSTVYLIAKTLQMAIEAQKEKRGRFGVPFRKEFHKNVFHGRPGVPYHEEGDIFRIDPYDFFAGMVSGVFDDPEKRKFRKDTIITFNYDLVCEHALRRFGIEADYALDPEKLIDHRELEGKERFEVLKLHGSTNWGICGACETRVVVLSQKVTDSPGEFRKLTCPNCTLPDFVPLLIPPSWDKSGYADIIAPVWKRAVDELKAATRICIIGYSIPETDAFFKFLITMALAGNHQLYKLVVVDYRPPIRHHPASLEVDGYKKDFVKIRYLKLLDKLFRERRFAYYDEGFMRFLSHYWSRRDLGRCEMLVDTDFGT
jgi:hypothetical protein